MEFPLTGTPVQRTSKNVFPVGVEGEWTPTLSFTTPGDVSVSYSLRRGSYLRIGSFVFCVFAVQTSAFTHSTAAGNLIIDGLPVLPKTTPTDTNWGGGSIRWSGITKAGYTDLFPAFFNNLTRMGFAMSGSGVGTVAVLAADVPSGGIVILQGNVIYIAATET